MRKKHIFGVLILCVTILSACSTEDGYIGNFDSAIIESSSNTNKFRQITFTVNVINNSSNYLYVTKLDSIELKVNGKVWGVFSTEEKDTASYSKTIINSIPYSTIKMDYLVIAPYYLKTESLETAGEFVEYLNNRIVLTPGEYVCEISKIKFRDINNQIITIKPEVYKDFKVTENTTSSFVGEVTIILED